MRTVEGSEASDDTGIRLSPRTPYTAPRLVALGGVATLTLAPSSASKQGPRADGNNPFSISRS